MGIGSLGSRSNSSGLTPDTRDRAVSIGSAQIQNGAVTYAKTDGHAVRKASDETITGDWTLSDSVTEVRGNSFDDTSIGAWARATRLRVGSILDNEGDGSAGSPGEDVVAIQAYTPALTNPETFEKTALLVRHRSNYDLDGASTPRDVVGIDTRGEIEDTNSQGRVWGLYAEGQIRDGGDGNAKGAEISIHNNGTDQPLVNSTTSKNALVLTTQDNGASSAIWIKTSTSATFHNGIVCAQEDLADGSTDTFINVHGASQDGSTSQVFNVLRDGRIGIGRRPATAVGLDMVGLQSRSERASGTDNSYATRVTGDVGHRLLILANGQMNWSNGTDGPDANLRRPSAGILATSATFQLDEVASAPSALANSARLFAVDNGSGKTRLMVQFPTGTAQEIKIEA